MGKIEFQAEMKARNRRNISCNPYTSKKSEGDFECFFKCNFIRIYDRWTSGGQQLLK